MLWSLFPLIALVKFSFQFDNNETAGLNNTIIINSQDSKLNSQISFVEEINDIEVLKKYLASHQHVLIEIYSPTCPHCVEFAPKYEQLSLMYKDKLTFIKIDGSDPKNYRSLVKVEGFPTVLLYSKGKLFQYRGIIDLEYLYDFIENVHFFHCKKLESARALSNLLNENVSHSHGKKASFILGILDQNSNLTRVEDLFIRLNEENKLIVDQCYYYPADFNTDEYIKSDSNILSQRNVILSYNDQKGFHTFSQFGMLAELNESDLDYSVMYKNIMEKYKMFMNENLFHYYEEWDDFKLYNFLSRDKNLLIFSYKGEEEKLLMVNLAKKYSLAQSNSQDKEYVVLTFDLNQLPGNMKSDAWKYYYFGQASGIFTSSIDFHKVSALSEPRSLTLEQLSLLLPEWDNEKNKKKDKDKDKDTASSNSNILSKKDKLGYISAKIVDSLDELRKSPEKSDDTSVILTKDNTIPQTQTQTHTQEMRTEQKFLNVNNITHNEQYSNHANATHQSWKINTKIFIIPIYLMIYSAIFFIFYTRYLQRSNHEEEKLH